MSMTVLLNEVRAGTETTDRLVTYQPSADPSVDIASCIDMVVAVKGRYTNSPDECTGKRVDKFMAHLSFGKSDRVPSPGYESNQGSLENLEVMVEWAKCHGLTGLRTWNSILSPDSPGCEDQLWSSPNRWERAMDRLGLAESMPDRLGGPLRIMSHPAGLLKVELRSDGEFSSYDGLNTKQDGSDGIPLATYQKLVSILR
jgi:hypothetical protein